MSRGLFKRAGTMTLATVVGLGALAVPASATQSFTTFDRASWAFTDVRSPLRSFTDGTAAAPVGSWRDGDGRYHLSKSYFTIDLSAFRGARIFAAQVFVAETSANDCTKPRMTEMWSTTVSEQPTWARQPKEITKLPGPFAQPGCLWDRVTWDGTELVKSTLAAGKSKMTLALRMPEDRQGDPAIGRHYDNRVRIMLTYNRPPNVPTNLQVDGLHNCSDGPFFLANNRPGASALVSDPDGSVGVFGRFAFWPVAHPEQRVEQATTPTGGYRTGLLPVHHGHRRK